MGGNVAKAALGYQRQESQMDELQAGVEQSLAVLP